MMTTLITCTNSTLGVTLRYSASFVPTSAEINTMMRGTHDDYRLAAGWVVHIKGL
jgi:hypothetical protein